MALIVSGSLNNYDGNTGATEMTLAMDYVMTGNKYTCTSTIEADLYLICTRTGYYGGSSFGTQSQFTIEVSNGLYLGQDETKRIKLNSFYANAGDRVYITSVSIVNNPHNTITGIYKDYSYNAITSDFTGTAHITIRTKNNLYYYADAGATALALDYFYYETFKQTEVEWPVIPRDTTISIPTSAYIADYLNIVIERLNTNFTHSIKYKFGTKEGYLLQNSTASSYNWLIPIAFMDEIPENATSAVCTLTIETYYIDALTATNEYQITLKIDTTLTGPVLEPTIVDINNITVALTGDSSVIIKDCSVADCDTNATMLVDNDIIKSSYIKNGETTKEGTAAVFIAPTSRSFEFYVETRRGLVAKKTVTPTFIDYVSPTCRQKITTTISGEENTNATVTLLITGNYFNGNFGAADNELKIEVQHTQNDGTMGDWVDLTSGLIPVFEGNTYSLEVTITGLRHDIAYTFTTRVTDKLKSAESEPYVARVLPVFDWSSEDFNFNVPVNMNGQTVLRHNETANNTVLSASGGFIYFRQGGTNDTATEVKITPQGNIELVGDIIINGQSLKSLLGIT